MPSPAGAQLRPPFLFALCFLAPRLAMVFAPAALPARWPSGRAARPARCVLQLLLSRGRGGGGEKSIRSPTRSTPHLSTLHTHTQACPLGFAASSDGAGCLPCLAKLVGSLTPTRSNSSGLASFCRACANSTRATLPGSCPAGAGRMSCDPRAKCTPCQPGTFAAASVGRVIDTCRPCGRSTYSDRAGATRCAPCPANRAFLGWGGTTVDDCDFKYANRTLRRVRETIVRDYVGLLRVTDFSTTPRVIQVRVGRMCA